MNRKLIKQGGGGYTIYLPKKWVDKKELKAGDQIDIIETETSLIIGGTPQGKKETIIDLSEEKNLFIIKMLLTHLYRNGFDIITINGVDKKQLDEIQKITKDLLLGFEVTENYTDSCKIENISEPTEQKYEIILKRTFFIIKETMSIIKTDFENNNFVSMSYIEDMRNQQDKLILFCRRTLMKERHQKNPVIDWELLTFLMHIEHACYYLYKFAYDNRITKDSSVNKLLNDLQGYFDLYYNAYYKKEIKDVNKITSLKKEFQFGKCLSLLEKSKGKNTIILSYIREIFRLIQIGSSPVLSELLRNRTS